MEALKNKIILFDGDCNLCDQSVQFIIKRDTCNIYKFASIQSEAGQKLIKKYKVPEDIDSIILMDETHYFTKSTAVLRICKNLNGVWKTLYWFILIPRPFRDGLYHIIARNRYKWFGKKANCMIPTPEIRSRFLE